MSRMSHMSHTAARGINRTRMASHTSPSLCTSGTTAGDQWQTGGAAAALQAQSALLAAHPFLAKLALIAVVARGAKKLDTCENKLGGSGRLLQQIVEVGDEKIERYLELQAGSSFQQRGQVANQPTANKPTRSSQIVEKEEAALLVQSDDDQKVAVIAVAANAGKTSDKPLLRSVKRKDGRLIVQMPYGSKGKHAYSYEFVYAAVGADVSQLKIEEPAPVCTHGHAQPHLRAKGQDSGCKFIDAYHVVETIFTQNQDGRWAVWKHRGFRQQLLVSDAKKRKPRGAKAPNSAAAAPALAVPAPPAAAAPAAAPIAVPAAAAPVSHDQVLAAAFRDFRAAAVTFAAVPFAAAVPAAAMDANSDASPYFDYHAGRVTFAAVGAASAAEVREGPDTDDEEDEEDPAKGHDTDGEEEDDSSPEARPSSRKRARTDKGSSAAAGPPKPIVTAACFSHQKSKPQKPQRRAPKKPRHAKCSQIQQAAQSASASFCSILSRGVDQLATLPPLPELPQLRAPTGCRDPMDSQAAAAAAAGSTPLPSPTPFFVLPAPVRIDAEANDDQVPTGSMFPPDDNHAGVQPLDSEVDCWSCDQLALWLALYNHIDG